jgi:beta-galactosidase
MSLSFQNPDGNKTFPDITGNRISLNGTWKFRYIPALSVSKDSLFYSKEYDISGWDDIQVPGHWELQGFAIPTYKTVEEGTGLYRSSFSLPSTMKNQQIFIRFEGVLYAYDVFVNGEKIGNWSGSFNPANFNITNAVRFNEDNILAVRVSTRCKGFQFDISDCWALSGIFREVMIYSTPNLFIGDYTVQTFLNDDRSARINLNVKLMSPDHESLENYSLKAMLYSFDGKIVQEKFAGSVLQENKLELTVKNPVLWTAETPCLYKLSLLLIRKEEVIQKVDQQVGIREISIQDAVLKLNGKAIKLRGINHHDLVPETGRTMTRNQILKDLMLMQKANINFIRTSHYPPDRRILDLCDSLGFYVACEVPFNFGSGLLKDSSYQEILLKRAQATLLRDKNHPSVIIWSVGNENPLTPITEITGKYVKDSDPTRPICYPQIGTYFNDNYQAIPDFVDLYTPHYQSAAWVKNFAKETGKPVILTEYAHALGLSFGNVAEIWQEMFRDEKFAGGAVWHFQDQGILWKADRPVDTGKPTNKVWIDPTTCYDMGGIDGLDGIVYADRTPQVDYWQLRKVYAPVQIIESEIPVRSGNQELEFTVYNQYDFINLNTLDGYWKLFRNRKIHHEGKIRVNCAPHDTTVQTIPCDLPLKPEYDVWLLQFEFKDRNGESVYEHVIGLVTPDRLDKIKQKICEVQKKGRLKIDNRTGQTKIETNGFVYEVGKNNLAINLKDKRKNMPLISHGVFARVGRTPKIADITVRDKYLQGNGDYDWYPFLLESVQVENDPEKITKDEYRFSATGTFLRGEKFPGQRLEGKIQYTIKSTGELTVNYNLKPVHVTGAFLEAGLSFILSSEISDFTWLGDGPYSSYPDKRLLNGFGLHAMEKEDIHFNGNRTNVEIAVLSDCGGNGIIILGNRENISVELSHRQIVVSHNALLSGLGNKKTTPTQIVWAQNVNEISGEFTIIPLRAGHWPEKLTDILGSPNGSVTPFQPFYYSYDMSK